MKTLSSIYSLGLFAAVALSEVSILPLAANAQSCPAYDSSVVSRIRQRNVPVGNILINNNYGSDPQSGAVIIKLYHSDAPDRVFSTWSFAGGESANLAMRDNRINIGGDWGIQIVFGNGVTSCISPVADVGRFENGRYVVTATDIYRNNSSSSDADHYAVQLRESIRSWAQHYLCEGITPTRHPDQCNSPHTGTGDGDSILFSSVLCFSGERWACQNIEASKDNQGGMWRSPQRLRSRVGERGLERFSQDQMLGVLLYLVSEKNYGVPSKARDFANHWSSWMDNHRGPEPLGHFVMCPGSLSDADACDLEIFYRARIVRHVFDYVGANSPQRGNWVTGRYRLGDGDGDGLQGFMNYLGGLCYLHQDFHCHLAAVTSLIIQETGIDKRPGVNAAFRRNPFSLWVNNGRRVNEEIINLAYDRCSSADKTHRNNPGRPHTQWTWERPDNDRDYPVWEKSFGWDCIAMLNLIIRERPTLSPGPISPFPASSGNPLSPGPFAPDNLEVNQQPKVIPAPEYIPLPNSQSNQK